MATHRNQSMNTSYTGVRDRSRTEFARTYSNTYANRTTNSYTSRNTTYTSNRVDGNLARSIEPQRVAAVPTRVEPARKVPERRPQEAPRPRRRAKVQEEVRPASRADQGIMTANYVGVLIVAAVVLLSFSCLYLSNRAEVSAKAKMITDLQQGVSDLKIENDAKLGIVGQTVNMESVKQRATEMGMVFMEKEQIIYFESPIEDVVKQYDAIPTSGVLAQSEKAFE